MIEKWNPGSYGDRVGLTPPSLESLRQEEGAPPPPRSNILPNVPLSFPTHKRAPGLGEKNITAFGNSVGGMPQLTYRSSH